VNGAGIGTINISGARATPTSIEGVHTLVTSKNTTNAQGTILLADNGSNSLTRLNITGGRVENTNRGVAVYNNSIGQIIVNASTGVVAEVTSGNNNRTQGTIVLAKITYVGTESNPRLSITQGNVNNTGIAGNAIYNASQGMVAISGNPPEIDEEEGTYQSGTWVYADNLGGCAVNNVDVGEIEISGGTVEATGRGSIAVNNTSGGLISVSAGSGTGATNPTVSVNNAGSTAIYNASSSYTGSTLNNSVNITGGLVTATSGTTVYNHADGQITVAASTGKTATVTAKTGVAIQNFGDGKIVIGLAASPGTTKVEAGRVDEDEEEEADEAGSPGIAIYNDSFGDITINTASIESSNPNSSRGTIYYAFTSGYKLARLVINSGAKVVNKGYGGNAIYNNSNGSMTIPNTGVEIGVNKVGSDGDSDAKGYAIYNNSDNAYIDVTSYPTLSVPPTSQQTNGIISGIRGAIYGYFTTGVGGIVKTRFPRT